MSINQERGSDRRECSVCMRRALGDWFESGVRNRFTGETPFQNFVCDSCQDEARPRREFLAEKRKVMCGARGWWDEQPRDEEKEMARRYAATMARKVEAWQMPLGNGLSA